jgi:hypothetical protein
MKLSQAQRIAITDADYAMFDPLGNLMVGEYLVTLLETKDITDISELIDIAYSVKDAFPDTEASDTAVREAIVSVLEKVLLTALPSANNANN